MFLLFYPALILQFILIFDAWLTQYYKIRLRNTNWTKAGSTDSALRALAQGPPHLWAPTKKQKKGRRKK